MRAIHLAHLEELLPVLVLTREATRESLDTVTVAPISTDPLGLSSEVKLGAQNGVDAAAVAKLDEVMTLPKGLLAQRIGYLLPDQEDDLARACVNAFDLDVPLFS